MNVQMAINTASENMLGYFTIANQETVYFLPKIQFGLTQLNTEPLVTALTQNRLNTELFCVNCLTQT